MSEFDFTGPLPTNPLLLEASAGTGKTWTIATLTVRFIAEAGLGVEEALLITFTEKAARELRSRVFSRIQEAHVALAEFQATGAQPEDALAQFLCRQDVPLRLERLSTALADFDRATFTTIHSFCESMLKQLGVLGDWDADDQVLVDPVPVIEECAVDVYLIRYADVDPGFDTRDALDIARAACLSALPLSPPDGERAEYCAAVRKRFEERKRILGVVTFDDMPGRLRQVLTSVEVGESAKEALRSRFRLVMVDEFQDTDPVQWDLIREAFVIPGRPTVLIGDPKQSIYGFRDADLLSYLEAARVAEKQSLPTNHRSDEAVVAGVGELFGNVELGDADIVVGPVGTKHRGRFAMGSATAGVWIRRALEQDLDSAPETAVTADVTYMVAQLLTQARIGDRPVVASDIAVLARTGAAATQLVKALREAGIPAASAGTENVLLSSAGTAWERLLAAMADTRRSTVVLAACTDLMGFDLGLLASDSDASDQAHRSVRSLARDFEVGGIPAVLTSLAESRDLGLRVIALDDGERRLTDLLHVSEILAALPGGTVQELLDQFRRTRQDASADAATSRMSSDADAVRVMTLHSAKGLEFPVVLLPDLSNLRAMAYKPFPFVSGGSRMLHVGGKLNFRDPALAEFYHQSRDEELRLLYVGLTRAAHLAIAWHVGGKDSARGPLTALLGRDRQVSQLQDQYQRLPDTASLQSMFRGLVSVTDFDGTATAPVLAGPAKQPPLRAATMHRVVDQTWRRTSYSGLTAGLHESPHATTSDEPELEADPEAETELPKAPADDALLLPSPMASLPGGAGFGTLVHAAFEELDWTKAPLAEEVALVVPGLAARFGLDEAAAAALAESVVAACTTPLGGLAPGQALRDFPLAERLPELDFDLPLGDRGSAATVADIARLMADLLPAADPLTAYPAQLAGSESASEVLNGMLTGSIDAVLRTHGGRYLVVDYKTNRFPTAPEEALTVGHYQYPAMTEAMIRAHYPLQALLYCAALHRYLGWRLPGYHPDTHLGGVGYLFVRGMAGPDTPAVDGHVCGVFDWQPPTELVVATSELLGGLR